MLTHLNSDTMFRRPAFSQAIVVSAPSVTIERGPGAGRG
jgi:hypothetical protein